MCRSYPPARPTTAQRVGAPHAIHRSPKIPASSRPRRHHQPASARLDGTDSRTDRGDPPSAPEPRHASDQGSAPSLRSVAPDEEDDRPSKRRRGRRGGRGAGRGRRRTTLEATFDHGEEGYGLWLDPAVQDDPIYAGHWAGHRPVEVAIEEDQIVIRRAGGEDSDESE